MAGQLRNEDRRKELGKMFMDVAKFLATGGLISGILTNKLTFLNGLVIIAVVVMLGSLAYFTIPPKSGG